MHDLDRTQLETYGEMFETGFGYEGEMNVLSEAEEMELATELLAVSNEAELEQFLGSLIKKVGGAVGKFAKGPIGGMLKGLAKKALPFVGGALGSLIPIPGVGTMIGKTVGSAAANLFEVNLEGMSQEEQEFDVAQRFVRMAGAALANASNAGPSGATPTGAKAALIDAARIHAPGLAKALAPQAASAAPAGNGAVGAPGAGGRWIRRGANIILLGA